MVPASLPIPRALLVETLLLGGEGLTILASAEAPDAPCRLCGERADRVYSRYARTLADLPWAALPVRLRVTLRKFFCANPADPLFTASVGEPTYRNEASTVTPAAGWTHTCIRPAASLAVLVTYRGSSRPR